MALGAGLTLARIGAGTDSSVVDEHVEAWFAATDLGRKVMDLVEVGEVSDVAPYFGAGLAQFGCDVGQPPGVATVQKESVSLLGQRVRELTAKSLGRSGDQDRLV